MDRKNENELILWLRDQIRMAGDNLTSAKSKGNYGMEVVYQGKLIAFVECLERLKVPAS